MLATSVSEAAGYPRASIANAGRVVRRAELPDRSPLGVAGRRPGVWGGAPRPVGYQDVGGRRVAVGARYVVEPDRSISVAVAPYDVTAPLVIDPTITYATYFGAAGHDDIRAVEPDGAGHMYLAGIRSGNGYVAKMALDGSVPWITMIGGSGDDGATAPGRHAPRRHDT